MRITEDMSILDAGVVMAQGNPGAATVIGKLVKSSPIEGILDVVRLDEMEIYGSNIWLCYKDICKEDLETLQKKIRDGSIKGELVKLPDYQK